MAGHRYEALIHLSRRIIKFYVHCELINHPRYRDRAHAYEKKKTAFINEIKTLIKNITPNFIPILLQFNLFKLSGDNYNQIHVELMNRLKELPIASLESKPKVKEYYGRIHSIIKHKFANIERLLLLCDWYKWNFIDKDPSNGWAILNSLVPYDRNHSDINFDCIISPEYVAGMVMFGEHIDLEKKSGPNKYDLPKESSKKEYIAIHLERVPDWKSLDEDKCENRLNQIQVSNSNIEINPIINNNNINANVNNRSSKVSTTSTISKIKRKPSAAAKSNLKPKKIK